MAASMGQVELDPTRRASTVCTDLRRHSIISQPQGSEDPSLLLSTPESRVELLHSLGLNRESEAPRGLGAMAGCGSKALDIFGNYSSQSNFFERSIWIKEDKRASPALRHSVLYGPGQK